MEPLLRDLRHALRRLRQDPGFTFLAVASLGIGLGAVTTIFSLADAFLLRPLPLPEPGRLVYAYESSADGSGFHSFSYLQYRDLSRRSRSLKGLAAIDNTPLSVATSGEGQIALGLNVSGNYFQVMGARPALGRFFRPEEDSTPGTHPVAVVSHAFWRRQLAGDSAAVGRTIHVNGHAFTVIGVASADFTGVTALARPSLWTPIMMSAVTTPGLRLDVRSYNTFQLVGRLADGVTLRAAERDLTSITKQIAVEDPSSATAGVQLFPYTSMPTEATTGVALFLALLMAFAVLILLVACANLASMLLARAIQRRREVAIRMALGAARGRLVRAMLAETTLLFLGSTSVAAVLAIGATRAIAAFRPPIEVPLELDVRVDLRVLLFSASVALVVGMLFGLVPALRATRTSAATVLKDEAGSVSSRSRLRNALVIGQVAFTCLLLVCAGLVVRALHKATVMDPGFDPRNVQLATTNLQMGTYDASAGRRLIADWRDAASHLPGVTAVAITRRPPLGLGNSTNSFRVEGAPAGPESEHGADYTEVSPEYFGVMRIPIVQGRGFASEDAEGSPGVVVVSAALARRYLDGIESAVGKRLSFGNRPQDKVTVIGVSADTKVRSIVEEPRPMLYRSIYQGNVREVSLLARTAPGATGTGRAMGAALRRLDPDLPLMASSSLEEHVGLALLPQRLAAIVSATLGFAALALAAIGVYGIVAYAVARRTREIGIRVAIGATPSSVVSLVAREGLTLAGIGLGVGVVLALLATRAMSAFLLGVSPADALTFVAIAVPLAGITVLASWVPARRAARVDPLLAMRRE